MVFACCQNWAQTDQYLRASSNTVFLTFSDDLYRSPFFNLTPDKMKLTVDNAASADDYVQRPSSNGQITDRFENRGNHDQDQSNYSHPPRLEHRSSGNHLHPTQNTESRKGEERIRHSRTVNRKHRLKNHSPYKNRPSNHSSTSRQGAELSQVLLLYVLIYLSLIRRR